MVNSIWADDMMLASFPTLDKDLSTDVLIVGGGIAGLLCAHMLTKAGIDCALIEADRICHGVTRNTTAKITSQHGVIYASLLHRFGAEAARLYWEVNEAALAQYRSLCQDIPCDFQERSAYLYATGPSPELDSEWAALQRLGIPARLLDDSPLPFPVAHAIQMEHQAQFHPLKFIAGLLPQLRIFEHTPAISFHGHTVETPGGLIQARKVVIATHFPLLNKHGCYFMKLYQHRSYVMALENAPDVQGMYLAATADGLSLRNQGDLLLIGGGSHRTGQPGAGWHALEAFVQGHLPTAREHCRWATQDCMTLDGMPYAGRYSHSTPNLYVMTGFNKWGMTSAMVCAMLLCDMLTGRSNPCEALFSPSRSMLHPQLMTNLLESVGGLMRLTRPRCPHLGCALRWNAQEHSWDCPCHGSRFSQDGHLLDNPATGNLKRS